MSNLENSWAYLKPRDFGTLSPQDYIEERLNQYRAWYDSKASDAKKKYLAMRAISVIGGAIVPVLINIKIENSEIMKYVASAISLVVVVLVSLETVYHYREQWKNYRSTEQLLAKEYFNFSSGEGPYRKANPYDSYLLFVERVESAIESENSSTLNVMTTLTESKASKNL